MAYCTQSYARMSDKNPDNANKCIAHKTTDQSFKERHDKYETRTYGQEVNDYEQIVTRSEQRWRIRKIVF